MYDNIVFFSFLFLSFCFVLFGFGRQFRKFVVVATAAAKVFHCLTAVFFFLHNCNCTSIVVKG